MPQSEILEMAAQVVAAFVSNNPLPKGELPTLIQTIHDWMARVLAGWGMPPRTRSRSIRHVSIRESITPEFVICLEVAKSSSPLKRHLGTHGLTPDQFARNGRQRRHSLVENLMRDAAPTRIAALRSDPRPLARACAKLMTLRNP